MERNADSAEADDDADASATAVVEAMVRRGVEEIYLHAEVYRKLEAECAPMTVEEYFDVPIYVTGRH